MKKFLTLAVVAVASVFGASADSLYLGGSIGFMHNEVKGSKTNNFSIIPEIGYNINDSWAVGTTIGYTLTGYCNANHTDHTFDFNPYARWSFFRTDSNKVQLFVDGTVGIGLVRSSYENYATKGVSYQFGFKPGVAFNVTDNFSLVAHFGFLGYKGANDNAFAAGRPREAGFFLNGNDLNLGFYYTF